MKQTPFYEEYLHNVVIHKMVEVIGVKKPSSKAEFRRAFNEYFGLNVSYEQFNQWIHDLGIRVEKQATISVPGMGVPEGPRAPAPPGTGYQPPPPPPTPPMPNTGQSSPEYMFGAQPPANPAPPQSVPPMPAPGRGGIQIPG